MQYVWQHRLLVPADMLTVDGKRVQIIDPGQLNTNSGPDFFNAKVNIDGHLWAGDVEIHVRASDWHRHGHDGDPAYDSVILHVVDRDDTLIHRRNGEVIPQMVMRCSPEFSRCYSDMVGRSDIDLPCALRLKEFPTIYLSDWLSSLAYERLYAKSDHLLELLERMQGDWESVCYITIARSLGFGVNGEPFERLAQSMPLRFVGKHSDSLFTIEALLFGQSGLLDKTDPSDTYAASLRREYDYMAHKFGLRALQSAGWKMSRMRPANFPHRRIAVLAAMLHNGSALMSRFLETESAEDVATLLNPALSGYWEHRYSFGAPSPRAGACMSQGSVNGIIINAVVPLMFAYGENHADEALTARAVTLLQNLPPERNFIIDMFRNQGVKVPDAFHSQALIQLRRCYCETHKCLYCRIGHRMLAAQARRKA